MQRKINTNITLDNDLYDKLQEESHEFNGSFSKAANHYIRIGMEKVWDESIQKAIERDNLLRSKHPI